MPWTLSPVLVPQAPRANPYSLPPPTPAESPAAESGLRELKPVRLLQLRSGVGTLNRRSQLGPLGGSHDCCSAAASWRLHWEGAGAVSAGLSRS
ncbi:hypothetical protein AAY473_004471 [Plecturocebus cupreus]